MAVTTKWFGQAFLALANKEIDWVADTIKVSLHTSAFTPGQDTMNYFDDLTDEVVGTGYTADGEEIANKSQAYDGATNIMKIDGDDVSWPGSTITARYAVITDVTPGTDATNPLICWVDFGEDVSTSSGTLEIQWNADGIARVTVS